MAVVPVQWGWASARHAVGMSRELGGARSRCQLRAIRRHRQGFLGRAAQLGQAACWAWLPRGGSGGARAGAPSLGTRTGGGPFPAQEGWARWVAPPSLRQLL